MLRLVRVVMVGVVMTVAGCGTPWDSNDPEPAGQTADLRTSVPILRPAGGQFDGSVTVVLSCDTPGARFRYILDGAGMPSPYHGELYLEPIRLERSARLQVVAFCVEMQPSEVVSAEYTINP